MKSTKISILICVCSFAGLLVCPLPPSSLSFVNLPASVVVAGGGLGWGRSEPASERVIQILFWYPGEAGSTEEAQGTIDIFFDHVNKHLAPLGSGARSKAEGAESVLADATPKPVITGKYFNTVNEGLNFIKQVRPKLGIIGFAAYTINKERLGKTTILLQTLPLPHGNATENYTIVGKGTSPWSSAWQGATPLYTKQPLTKEFVQKYILGKIGVAPDRALNESASSASLRPLLQPVPNILPTLKDVASGAKTGGVILQPMEYHTLKNLNQPWVKNLTVWHTSPPVPTAPLVVFGETTPLVEKVKEILLKMPQDKEGKEILETLRLHGFTLGSDLSY